MLPAERSHNGHISGAGGFMPAMLYVQAAMQNDDGVAIQVEVRRIYIPPQSAPQLINGIFAVPHECHLEVRIRQDL